ncbi:ABC transporter related protein [Xylanimonas cellulosilytica DSM 15894]|uniref:ABC transporter related protein n=1 Tax=Xylanimonas cellulosilytica (strain DSM 15894 / JCM 12276 / CECT 5975 / KCTC 9989 / LMG 20990 / NBRC 107835 / XIL07) TaxID=446471 RepID=D1BU21_XYLCX|nr:ABC transporter ATP-binding protein [Xylanimonas cellulosilytica]ACZ29185.1 ABC transporter related protein [Xylanimonas cellulosilytica DSM 15894]
MTIPIEIRDLHKSFGTTKALDGLDLTVEQGQVAGFLGPNGAGKSTTIRVLLGLLKADSGDVRLLGGDPWRDAVDLHRRLTYVPGDVSLWPNLTGGEAIDLLARLRGGLDKARKAELLERFELDPTKKARTYSKGNRQKVALVAALASDAELLILDEPTSGLDPLMEAVFTDYLREVKARGRSVLLSSHIMSEVEKVCDTVTIIRSGRSVEHGTLDDLRHLTRSAVSVLLPDDDAVRTVSGLPGVHDVVAEPGADGVVRLRASVDNDHMTGVLASLGAIGVRGFTATPPSLEEMFMRHYGDELPTPPPPVVEPVETTPPPAAEPHPVVEPVETTPERGEAR